MLQIGSILDRKYKILDVIGRGGMSVIYLARNERANKTWAIKEVRKEGVIDEQANLAGLIAETNLLKELNHPNIVSIIDVIDRDDSFIIVMDYIEGKDLKKVIDEEKAQDPERVRRWGITICKIFTYLHSQTPPIIYRDLKPNNLMLTEEDKIVLIDFGTARKYKYESQADDTKPLGTIGYAAPEQYGGHGETDARTDIYTIGATLFHLLTGISPADPPYYGVTLLRNVDPAFEGSGWEYVINKCCQQKREDRYQSCEELRYDLEHLEELSHDESVKRKRKWNAFIASVILCLVGGVGMLAFNALNKSASAQTYEKYISDAQAQPGIMAAESFYKQAMRIDPRRTEAYEMLIAEISQDGVLTDEEISVLTSCLRESNDSTRMNYEYLQARNQEVYERLMYQVGVMYFFMHNNNANDMKTAASYFEQVRESDYLSAAQRNLADCLYTIGTYYGSLDSERNLYLEQYSYSDLWNNLCQMVEGNVSEKVGRPSFAIALYNQMAYQIFSNYEHFNEFGISRRDMEEQLDIVEDGLAEISGGNDLLKVKQAASDMVESARRSLASYFDRRG